MRDLWKAFLISCCFFFTCSLCAMKHHAGYCLLRDEIDSPTEDEDPSSSVSPSTVDAVRVSVETLTEHLGSTSLTEERPSASKFDFSEDDGLDELECNQLLAEAQRYRDEFERAHQADLVLIKKLITCLHEKKYDPIAAFIYENRRDVGRINLALEDGTTLLYAAAHAGETHVVNSILSVIFEQSHCARDLNPQRRDGLTPLHIAALRGYKNIVILIADKIRACAGSLDVATLQGITPLHLATYEGRIDVVQVLVAFGAKANVRLRDGRSPADLVKVQHFLLRSALSPVTQPAKSDNGHFLW